MQALSGGCHCGNIRLDLQLTHAPADYQPRACDCDFCRMHGAAYVSDAAGTLQLRIRDPDAAGRYRQGSGRAELVLCRTCGVLIGAVCAIEEQLYGTVNARALDAYAQFGAAQTVSPRTLNESDKVRRWQQLWFPNVVIRS
jgi:hypothetical protein